MKDKNKQKFYSQIQIILLVIHAILTLGSAWIELIFDETENWKHCSKIIFKCVNSAVKSIFNIFKCMNSAVIMREQWFLSLYSKFMWFYCSCAKKKKKKTTEHRRAKRAIQTGTFLDFFLAEIPLKKSFFEEAKPKSWKGKNEQFQIKYISSNIWINKWQWF